MKVSFNFRHALHNSFIENRLLSGSKYPASKKLYEKTIERIELISRVIYFLMIYVSVPAFILPKYFLCLYFYFSTDLGPDALELPIPAWWEFEFIDAISQ